MNRTEDRLLPVLQGPARPRDRRPIEPQLRARDAGPYAAQLLGQDGQKRGLRGGAPVLEAARAAYLGAEYCGAHDRRPSLGLIKRTSI
jgi:hypothetical protein